MTVTLNFIGYILLAVLLLLFVIACISIIQYLYTFYCHKCKHCGGIMEYKGLKEDMDNGHFLFHCSHCGAWEEIPKNEIFSNYKDK